MPAWRHSSIYLVSPAAIHCTCYFVDIFFWHLFELQTLEASRTRTSSDQLPSLGFCPDLNHPSHHVAMEPIAPIAINVVLPSGEQVAQLMVNPEKSIMQMKTQIAGLEGTWLHETEKESISNCSLFFLLFPDFSPLMHDISTCSKGCSCDPC